MALSNCWEVKDCGRQPGGARVAELGTCPAATASPLSGVHGGTHGGRACWAISGTLCGGRVQGTFAAKYVNCMECSHYQRVRAEAGRDFVPATRLVGRMTG